MSSLALLFVSSTTDSAENQVFTSLTTHVDATDAAEIGIDHAACYPLVTALGYLAYLSN